MIAASDIPEFLVTEFGNMDADPLPSVHGAHGISVKVEKGNE